MNSQNDVIRGPSSAAPIEELFQQAEEARYRGHWDEAIDLYDQLLHLASHHTRAVEGRDKALVAKHRGDQVFAQLPTAVKRPFQMAQSRERMGLYQQAKSLYQEAKQEASKHGIEHWPEIEERLRTIEQAIWAQEQISQANALVKKDRWHEALSLLRQVTEVMNTTEYRAEWDKIQRLKSTYDEVRQAWRTLARRLRQTTGQSTLLERLTNEVEALEDRLQPLLMQFPESKRLRQLDAELSASLLTIADQRRNWEALKLQASYLEGQRLLHLGQKGCTMGRKKELLLKSAHILEQIVNRETRADDQLIQTHFLLELIEQSQQTIPNIEAKLDSANHLDVQTAYHWFLNILPALLHTKKLNQLEDRLLESIRRQINELIRAKQYAEARQMITLLNEQIFRHKVSQWEIKDWQQKAAARPLQPTAWLLIGFLSGVTLTSFLIYVYVSKLIL